MLSVSRLLNGTLSSGDVLRYGRSTAESPAHMLHFSADKKPVVVWNITQRCNLHCAHCYADSHDRDYPGELTTAEGLRLIEQLADFGVPTVLFSGGEPLKRPDVFELAVAAHEAGMRTVLSTNGTLIDDETAARLQESHFSYIGISLDGIGKLHNKLRGKHGAFEDALKGIAASQRAGLRTGLRYTINKMNRDQLGDIFELVERERIDRLCVYHLAYSGRGEKIKRFDLTPDETREAINEVFDRVEDMKRRGVDAEVLTVGNPVDGALLAMRLRERETERAIDVERLLRWNGGNQSGVAIGCVDPTGNVHPDQFSWTKTVGNVRDNTFGEIWGPDNPLLAPYRGPRELSGRCQSCSWREICNGGLRVRAMSADGDFSAADPGCYLRDDELAMAQF